MPPALRTHHVPNRLVLAALFAVALASAACGSSANTFTTPSTSPKCSVTATASGSTLSAAGGTAAIAVSTARECQWTATSDGAWLTVTGGSAGQGPGTVDLAAAANVNPTVRTAAVVVNDQRVELTQAAAECHLDLSATSTSLGATGGTGSVDVHASSAGCPWTASSGVSWIAITSPANVTGSGRVTFDVSPTTGGARSGTLKIAGQVFTVNQSEGCAYQIAPATFAAPAAGGDTTVTVTTGPGCVWSAASAASWMSIAPAAGSGPATITVSVAPASATARTGTATIAGQTFTVTQPAQTPTCTVTISPASASVPAAGGTGRIDVSAGATCGWAVASSAAWLSVTSGAAGSGSGAVLYTAAANAGPARTGTISVADRAFTVTQAGGCTASIAPLAQTVASGGATLSVTVTAGADCPWSATANVSWIAVPAGAAGSGNGSVQVVVAANTGAERTGSGTIAGQTFTVTQSSACAYALSPASQQMPASGGSGTFTITSGDGCGWTATPNVEWIAVTPSSGTGSAPVGFTAAPNTGAARTGTIAVAGQTFTVSQDAACTASVTPATLTAPAGGGTPTVQVNTPAACAWTAVSNDAWISVSPASGSGDATVQIAIAANTGPARTGTATIASHTVTITQDAACTFAISPARADVGKGGGNGTVTVSAPDGCAWTATSNVPWITIVGGTSGSGNGTVTYSVDKNPPEAPARSGTLTIAGHEFTVDQKMG